MIARSPLIYLVLSSIVGISSAGTLIAETTLKLPSSFPGSTPGSSPGSSPGSTMTLEPRVCTGFNPERNEWGMLAANFDSPEKFCPRGYALLAHTAVAGRWWFDPNQFNIEGSCCPLPEGVLTDQSVFVDERCPEDYVATGSRTTSKVLSLKRGENRYSIRCTKIDTSRFTLGPPNRGWRVGWGEEAAAEWIRSLVGRSAEKTTWSRIPAGLRYGILRKGSNEWEPSGCLGHPWGGVLVARSGNNCADMTFRNIFFKGEGAATADDPRREVPVFPACRTLDRPFAPDAQCADAQSSPGS